MLQVDTALGIRAKLFRGLADPSRLAIVEMLRHGPLSVTEIMERTGLSQSNTSMHLACLRGCGLVVGASQGRFVVYSLAEGGVEDVLSAADALLARIGEKIYACTRGP